MHMIDGRFSKCYQKLSFKFANKSEIQRCAIPASLSYIHIKIRFDCVDGEHWHADNENSMEQMPPQMEDKLSHF